MLACCSREEKGNGTWRSIVRKKGKEKKKNDVP